MSATAGSEAGMGSNDDSPCSTLREKLQRSQVCIQSSTSGLKQKLVPTGSHRNKLSRDAPSTTPFICILTRSSSQQP